MDSISYCVKVQVTTIPISLKSIVGSSGVCPKHDVRCTGEAPMESDFLESLLYAVVQMVSSLGVNKYSIFTAFLPDLSCILSSFVTFADILD